MANAIDKEKAAKIWLDNFRSAYASYAALCAEASIWSHAESGEEQPVSPGQVVTLTASDETAADETAAVIAWNSECAEWTVQLADGHSRTVARNSIRVRKMDAKAWVELIGKLSLIRQIPEPEISHKSSDAEGSAGHMHLALSRLRCS